MVAESPIARRWRRWKAVFLVFLQDGLAYRAQGFIWVLTDVVTALVMPLVWIAATKGGQINGYGAGDFVLYYLSMLMIGSFVTSHFMWDISFEIREGVFTTHLIRPIDYFEFMTVRNFTWRCIRTCLFLPWCALFFFLFRSYLVDPHVFLGWQFWASVFLGHLVSHTFVVAMAMIALFTQEAQSIFELYYLPMLFLSGQMFPIAMFPEWVRNVAHVFPFYYTTGVPTEILIGRISPGQATWMLLVQVGWIVGSYLLFRLLFHLGRRNYASVGM